jgi:hypothetical protein
VISALSFSFLSFFLSFFSSFHPNVPVCGLPHAMCHFRCLTTPLQDEQLASEGSKSSTPQR